MTRQRTKILLCFILYTLLSSSCKGANYPSGVSFVHTKYRFEYIDWAPDSVRLVGSTPPLPTTDFIFGMKSCEVYILDREENTYLQVSKEGFSHWNGEVAWNPQEEQILYSTLDEFDDGNIGIVDLVTKEWQGLTWSSSADWFPDGESIAVNDIFEIKNVDVNTKKSEIIYSVRRGLQISSLSVSPDGKFIAVSADDTETDKFPILLISVNEMSDAQILTIQDGGSLHLDWAPDGEWIGFTIGNDIMAIDPFSHCMTTPLPLDEDFGSVFDFSWSPDGKIFAVSVLRGNKPGILFIETDSDFFQTWLATANCEQ